MRMRAATMSKKMLPQFGKEKKTKKNSKQESEEVEENTTEEKQPERDEGYMVKRGNSIKQNNKSAQKLTVDIPDSFERRNNSVSGFKSSSLRRPRNKVPSTTSRRYETLMPNTRSRSCKAGTCVLLLFRR